jgi:3' terminal RNA ribose 2'-O-methyltransferase Hen1
VLLSLTSTAPRATDLGFLLHKHPERVQSFDLPVGVAHVFYPEATEKRCTATLLLEVDPVGLVRGRRFAVDGLALAQYVNDRPYAATSMLAVALGRVLGSALKGHCPSRPELVDQPLPLSIEVPAVPDGAGGDLVHRLFAPLGWEVRTTSALLDPLVPAWGDSRYVDLRLDGTRPVHEALRHLYVLLPVLDGSKHYWVSADEVDKLLRAGEGWLAGHPECDLIMRRYLANQRSYVTDATARLTALDDTACDAGTDADSPATPSSGEGATTSAPAVGAVEPFTPLSRIRHEAVLSQLSSLGARRVVDLGCGEGSFLRELVADPSFTQVVGADVSARELDRAARRLGLDRMPDTQRSRLTLLQSSATYRDTRLAGFDAMVLMEVVEHVEVERLGALERTVFGDAAPRSVLVTTPNADHNVLFDSLPAGTMRHPDHRFEWSRAEFAAWAERVGHHYGYGVRLVPVGPVDTVHGPPTQMAVFTSHDFVPDAAPPSTVPTASTRQAGAAS